MLRRGQPLETALNSALSGLKSPADKGLAHALAALVLRWQVDLDTLIDSATQLPLAPDAKARMVLRIALVQWLKLGTPGHAAISTVLPLVDGGPRRLVHGVFGSLNRRHATLPDAPTVPDMARIRWKQAWGEAVCKDASIALADQPALDLMLKDVSATAEWAERLGGQSLMPGHIRLEAAARVEDLPGFAEGAWWVQDLAATLPARLLGVTPGAKVLDLCAAPGGKTMQLAAAGCEVTAVDINPKRMARLEENLVRTGLKADAVIADLSKWQPDEPVDFILLDAPCTATGIFRRHPDVLHRVRPQDIEALVAIQKRLLARAATWLKPEGRMVYCVCSLEQAEGEDQMLYLEEAGLEPAPLAAIDLPANLSLNADGSCLRTLPGQVDGGLDGFFIAAMRRKG